MPVLGLGFAGNVASPRHTGLARVSCKEEATKYHQFWPVKAQSNWIMSLCCNAHQIDVIVAVCAYTVLILGTWRVDAVVKPFKLLAVFVHVARCVEINCVGSTPGARHLRHL